MSQNTDKHTPEEPVLPEGINNEDLGKETRSLAEYLFKKQIPGFTEVRIMASLYNLINAIDKMNADTVTMKVGGWYWVNNPEKKTDYYVHVSEGLDMADRIKQLEQEREEMLGLLKRASATLISESWRKDYNSLIQKIEKK
jgi:hypothetical protein